MAPTLLFVIVLSLALSVSVSLPISRDDTTVQLSKSLSDSDVTERTSAVITETGLGLDEEIKPVPSSSTETVLEAFTVTSEADHIFKRIKREMVKPGGRLCPSDMIEFRGRCWTEEEYDEIGGDDYKEER